MKEIETESETPVKTVSYSDFEGSNRMWTIVSSKRNFK